jgi:hypothetical protein
MKRTIIEAPLGQDRFRSVVRLEGDACEPDGSSGFLGLGTFLLTLIESPGVIRHATDCPEEISIKHNGTGWVLESISYTARSQNENRPAS